MKKNIHLTKRLLRGIGLGTLAGLICFYGFSMNTNMPAEMVKWQTWSWDNFMMWSTITNRMLLWLVVALAWFVTIHPMCGFKFPVFVRGLKMWALVSLPMALWALMWEGEAAIQWFWFVLIAGAIIGMVIDLIITKIAGEGKALMG